MSRFIVAGIGRVGVRSAEVLRLLGHETIAIADRLSATRRERLDHAGVRIIEGDARTDDAQLLADVQNATAILATIDDDLANLEIGLEARRLNPQIRLVLRISDSALASRLQDALGNCRCLSTADLASPAFVGRSIGEEVRGAFPKGDQKMVLLHRDGPDEIMDFQRYLALHPRPKASELAIALHELREGLKRTPPLLKFILFFLILLAVLSVGIFSFGMKLTPLDSLYFVITTLTTTGYGDYTPKESPGWVKIYASLMMIAGSVTVAVLYSIITDALFAARLDRIRGRRRKPLTHHTIVVGLGQVGLQCVRDLHDLGLPIAVIERDEHVYTAGGLPKGIAYLAGDGREVSVLKRAGIERATSILILTPDDAVNLSIALACEKVRTEIRTIVRIYSHDLGRNAERVLKVDTALSDSEIAAPVLAAVAIDPHAEFAYEDGDALVMLYDDREPTRISLRQT